MDRDSRRVIQGLQRLLDMIERGELEAPRWFRQRLVGAITALTATAKRRLQ